MAPSQEKAQHYLHQLDLARCGGNWESIPELVRKLRKHAPDRSCLSLTAETECAISKATVTQVGDARPSTAVAPKDLGVFSQVPNLMSAIEEEILAEDKFQAEVCLGWLHWVVGEFNLAAVRLPKELEREFSQLEAASAASEWTYVCALKAAYLKARCFLRNDQRNEALNVLESGLPFLSIIWRGQGVGKQLRYWAELFLTEFCLVNSQALSQGERTLGESNSLACFRSWARYWETLSGPILGGYGFSGSVPRRRIWYEYYQALSSIVDDDLPYPTGYIGKITNEMSARNQLRMELKRVESIYESLLLAETTFPRADEEREEVEEFAKRAVQNWSVLTGRGWREQDLGQGGRESFTRGVLDILYRAATKTYHSTLILRCLFMLHLAVAEFDLAFQVFDSYLDIIKRGKARVNKTGVLEANLDDDSTALETVCHCIIALCKFGGQEAAEKARGLASELEEWLARLPQPQSSENAGETTNSSGYSAIEPNVIGQAWQAIGLAHAHWSRETFDAGARTEIQAKAVRYLRRSLSAEFGRSKDVRSIFALGLLLAERRELTTAIEVVKTALLSSKTREDEDPLRYGQLWQERSLVPLWHLLALLLSARQEYVMAARACEGAFEQFKDTAVLFGNVDLNYRSEHLNDAEKSPEFQHGLVDEMEDSEKESILEIKMTQLALVELLEGPDVAVNASYELLNLFGRFFGNVMNKPTLNAPQTSGGPPKSSAGTLRSIKGSIFGSRTDKGRSTRQVSSMTEKSNSTTESRPQTTQTTTSIAPTIQVTKENGQSGEFRQSRKSSRLSHSRRSESVQRANLQKRDSSSSRRRTMSSGPHSHGPTVVDGESFFTPAGEITQGAYFPMTVRRQPSTSSSIPSRRTLTNLGSFTSQRSRSQDLLELAPDATYTICNPLPIIQFSKDQVRRQRSAILVKVWQMIAGFYRRAGMFDDAQGAIGEAQKLVRGLQTEMANGTSESPTARAHGWAETKSLEELWGDVWAEFGYLALARGTPYMARADFESALTHFPDHPGAIVGLSNILLDIYNETLRPPPLIPSLDPNEAAEDQLAHTTMSPLGPIKTLPSEPLGLGSTAKLKEAASTKPNPRDRDKTARSTTATDEQQLPVPYKATSLPLVDRLAARDRAYGLLSGLTKLGAGWNDAGAWFALARAYEESGQPDKAKEVLWWCVELEEGTGVREWLCLGRGGYVV